MGGPVSHTSERCEPTRGLSKHGWVTGVLERFEVMGRNGSLTQAVRDTLNDRIKYDRAWCIPLMLRLLKMVCRAQPLCTARQKRVVESYEGDLWSSKESA